MNLTRPAFSFSPLKGVLGTNASKAAQRPCHCKQPRRTVVASPIASRLDCALRRRTASWGYPTTQSWPPALGPVSRSKVGAGGCKQWNRNDVCCRSGFARPETYTRCGGIKLAGLPKLLRDRRRATRSAIRPSRISFRPCGDRHAPRTVL